jgi:hypothetical protein
MLPTTCTNTSKGHNSAKEKTGRTKQKEKVTKEKEGRILT